MAKDKHPPGPCADRECPRHLCQGYWLGRDEGYEIGFDDGVQACPREHK